MRKEMITLEHKDRRENIFGIRGKGDLLAYFFWRCQGYVRGFMADHTAIRLVSRAAFLLSAFTVVFLIISPIWKFPKDAVPVAQAAEEEMEADPPPEEPAEESAETDPEPTEPETVAEAAPVPLDDPLIEPSDIYAEKGHSAVFKAYHPQAEDYQWEIYDTEKECWEKASGEAVSDSQDELLREVSSLQLTSDRDQSIRCQISTVNGTPLTYEAKLHVLAGEIKSIAADELKVQAGEYVSAMDIPVQVTYQDGSQDEITGLSGLYFLDQTESKRVSTTESGNLQETVTTIRTACEYDHVEDMGSQEGLLSYKSGEGFMDIPIAITGVDKTPPQITSLTLDGYEVTNIDQTVPVTVTIRAIDEVTPIRQLEYAFLPEGEDVQEAEWTKDASFTAEIDKNGIWTAYVKDESGNIASTERDLVVVDNKAPIVDLRLESQGWCKENKIYVSAEDALPVQYRYFCEETGEDSGWIDGSSKSILENGTWKIQVKDTLGNVAEKAIMIDNIDSKPPVIRSIKEKTEKESISNEE